MSVDYLTYKAEIVSFYLSRCSHLSLICTEHYFLTISMLFAFKIFLRVQFKTRTYTQ